MRLKFVCGDIGRVLVQVLWVYVQITTSP